ncbi:MAG: hypothetical protein LBL79_10810, partial [Prevotella sp.]|jgi:hypothetical protein|nr:hypothetical protein [Prevotella sp.]
MEVQKRTPQRRGNSVKKAERLSQEEMLNQLLDDHKQSLGDMVSIRIDSRTSIEVPANMTEEDRKKRVNNYLKHSNYKPV